MFLLLNLSFAFIELFYGVITNSLGLISDSFHMFFDCTALLAGLAASVIAKWRANHHFTYGYVRAEVLGGFVNGLFLLFISFFIFSEAVERLFEPPVVSHDRLFLVSVLGFLVNVIGIFAFQHGGAHHGHSHGGGGASHSHSHDYSSHGHSHHSAEDATTDNNNIDHGHSHHQPQTGGAQTQILQGVFLHILADTLGSVGVIISSYLIENYHWHIADPICSIVIAFLILISVYPLLRDSIGVLMQRTPPALDNLLPTCFSRVLQLEGVNGVQETHFWTLCTDYYVGGLKLEVDKDADVKYITSQTHYIFLQIGVKQLFVQVDL